MQNRPSPSTDGPGPNAMVYVDYENIYELLKAYGRDLPEIGFFEVIEGRLKDAGLNIVDFIVYGNFEKQAAGKQQTYLRSLGFQARQTSNNGKNSGDLELTVEALTHLYENPNIHLFVIISSDRDIIPLLKAIKYKNKFSYLISTHNGFNPIVIQYADYHEYIEDIFELTPQSTPGEDPLETLIAVDADTVSLLNIRRAQEVARYFYRSHIRERASALGKPVNLKGYLSVVARVVNRHPDEILADFKLAHCLKYVTIYQVPERGVCLKEGEKMGEL